MAMQIVNISGQRKSKAREDTNISMTRFRNRPTPAIGSVRSPEAPQPETLCASGPRSVVRKQGADILVFPAGRRWPVVEALERFGLRTGQSGAPSLPGSE